MNRYPIGFNAIGNDGRIGNESYYLTVVKQMKSAWQMVISNPELASRVYDVCEGKTNVIYRSFGDGDNDFWRMGRKSAQDYANELIAFQDYRLWLSALNEPNPSRTDIGEVKRLVNWLSDVIEIVCGVHGRKLIVGNFASGMYQLLHVETGLYDRLLRTIHKYRHICHLGLHEYSAVLMPMTFDSVVNGIRDRDNVQPEKWLYLDNDDKDFRLPDYRKEQLNWMYHLFRSNWLQHRCMNIGIEPVPIVLTEYGTDMLQDIQGENDVYEYFKNNHGGSDPNNPLVPHGFYNNRNAWDYYYPFWSTTEALFEQLKWSRLNYAPEWYKGILLFMWGYDEEFAPRGFNVAPDNLLHSMLIRDSESYTPIDIPEPEPPIEDKPTMPTGTIDLLEYLQGDGRVYDVAYHFASSGAQVVQTQTDGRRFYHVKGAIGWASQWEELWYDHDYIWRGTDCSPSLEELYQISENGEYGARWIQRFATVGTKHLSKPIVTFRRQSDGFFVPEKRPYEFRHWIEVYAIHPTFEFESKIVLNDVVELRGYLDDNDSPGQNFEIYFYAKGYGLVGWKDPLKGEYRSYISKHYPHGTQLERKTISWLVQPELPALQPKPKPIEDEDIMNPDINDPRWAKALLSPDGDYNLNVRKTPTTNTAIVAVIKKGRIRLGYVLRDLTDGDWIPIRIDGDLGATYDDGDFSIVGWVHGDFVVIDDYVDPEQQPDPDPPSDVRKYFYIPLPEAGFTQDEADELGNILDVTASWIETFGADKPLNERSANYLRWLSDIIVNWRDTISNSDGIVIVGEYDVDETTP